MDVGASARLRMETLVRAQREPGALDVEAASLESAADRCVVSERGAALLSLEHARGMLKKTITRIKRAETSAKKWRRKVAALERAS